MDVEERLEQVLIEWEGQRFYALRDRDTGLLVCPICRVAKFVSPEDLVGHLVAHAKRQLDRRRPPPQRPHQTSSSEES